MHSFYEFIRALVVKIGHRLEHLCHMAYLGAVGIEGHGKYKYAAILLLVVVLMNLVIHTEDE